jgi:carboxymethylenebutenolidase
LESSITLTASDGHTLSAYQAQPTNTPLGALVILQEFFGVNQHIRNVADGYAADGYLTFAPALFDRVEREVELPYDAVGMTKGRELRAALALNQTLLDVQAAISKAGSHGPVGVIGYCWGGTLAYLSATRLQGLKCAVGYYGAHIVTHATERTRVPVLLHFAERDEYIPLVDIARIQKEHPAMPIHSYPGTEHGFNCDEREFFEPKSAALARQRTLSFIAEHLR